MNEVKKGDGRTIFVAYGRNNAIRKAMFEFLRAIGLQPLEWSQAVDGAGKPDPTIGEILETSFATIQAAVVILAGDDVARLHPDFCTEDDKNQPFETQFTPHVRANVLFEAGMAVGLLPTRTVFVQIGPVRPFSDRAGRHTVHFDGTLTARQNLANRLRAAGCQVNTTGEDWHTAGNFGTPLPTPLLVIWAANAATLPVVTYCSEMVARGQEILESFDILRTGFITPLRRSIGLILEKPDALDIQKKFDECNEAWAVYYQNYGTLWATRIQPSLAPLQTLATGLQATASLRGKGEDSITKSLLFCNSLNQVVEYYKTSHENVKNQLTKCNNDLRVPLSDTNASQSLCAGLLNLSNHAKEAAVHAEYVVFNCAEAICSTLQAG